MNKQGREQTLEQLRAEPDAARELVLMLLEYGTEGLRYDILPEWARVKRW